MAFLGTVACKPIVRTPFQYPEENRVYTGDEVIPLIIYLGFGQYAIYVDIKSYFDSAGGDWSTDFVFGKYWPMVYAENKAGGLTQNFKEDEGGFYVIFSRGEWMLNFGIINENYEMVLATMPAYGDYVWKETFSRFLINPAKP